MSTDKLYKDTLEIPEKIQLELENTLIKVKGEKGELQRKLLLPKITLKKQDKLLTFTSKYTSKKQKRIINTNKAHIKNLFKGATEGFSYKLKVCSGHFPITIELQGKELIIKNFFGEKIPRKAKILENVDVTINGDEILLQGNDKELVGQTAANMERATKIKGRDRRVFQDGIWIVSKAGKEIK